MVLLQTFPWPHAVGGVGYLILRRLQPPTSSNGEQGGEGREEEWGISDLAIPWPLAWEVGEGERREEQQQLESQGA